jgi:hypothetical protein
MGLIVLVTAKYIFGGHRKLSVVQAPIQKGRSPFVLQRRGGSALLALT